jgi:hypothetical protein
MFSSLSLPLDLFPKSNVKGYQCFFQEKKEHFIERGEKTR